MHEGTPHIETDLLQETTMHEARWNNDISLSLTKDVCLSYILATQLA